MQRAWRGITGGGRHRARGGRQLAGAASLCRVHGGERWGSLLCEVSRWLGTAFSILDSKSLLYSLLKNKIAVITLSPFSYKFSGLQSPKTHPEAYGRTQKPDASGFSACKK